MDNNNKFPEQKAPEKNHDNAYVQVGEDGAPAIPPENNKETDLIKEDRVTTLDKR